MRRVRIRWRGFAGGILKFKRPTTTPNQEIAGVKPTKNSDTGEHELSGVLFLTDGE